MKGNNPKLDLVNVDNSDSVKGFLLFRLTFFVSVIQTSILLEHGQNQDIN